MAKTEFNENFKESSEMTDKGLKISMVVVFVINMLYSSGVMSYFVGLINSL